MTTLDKFRAADQKVTEIENNGGLFLKDSGATGSTKEYDQALEESQKLYFELESQGIYPF